MSEQENKELVRRFYADVWNNHNLKALREYCTEDFLDHNKPNDIALPPGLDGTAALMGMYQTAFPDLNFVVAQLVAEGEWVMARLETIGTNSGFFMGNPPTGKKVVVGGIETYRVVNGKFTECWSYVDFLGMMHQLGYKLTMEQ